MLPNFSSANTHIDDEEIQPAPRVGEVHLEAVGHPLEQHLDDKDVGEDFVGILQDGAYHLALFDVDVLKSLEEVWSYVTVIFPLDLLHSSTQPHSPLRCPCSTRAWGTLKIQEPSCGWHLLMYLINMGSNSCLQVLVGCVEW